MGGFFFAFCNKVLAIIGAILTGFLSLLPNTPFSWDLSAVSSDMFKVLLWIIPVQSIVTSVYAFISAVLVYYGIRILLKWLKVVGS